MSEISRSENTRVEVTSCPLCGSGSESHRYFESVEAEGQVEEYRICRTCGMVFHAFPMSAETQRGFYQSGYREMVQGSEQPTDKDLRIQRARAAHLLLFVRKELDQIGRCLDIGSSTGVLLRTFQDGVGCHGLGIEPGDVYREFSNQGGIETVESLSKIDPALSNRFDLITMSHVLEHLHQPVGYLQSLKQDWLTPGGSILIEVPNLYGHQALEPAHILAFSPATLRQTLWSAGFQGVRVKVHGQPRSRIIPLYITMLAHASDPVKPVPIRSAKAVVLKRRLGMAWRRWATRVFPRWAWLPWPD